MARPWGATLPILLGIAAVALLALAHTGEIRARAEGGLGRGMPEREAALARGFVLGADEGIDERTVEEFRRAGLSHLLAVSGQNVALLALLAMPLLAALGVRLRLRLVWILALISAYVPLAGAGPSIQRAGVMGALSVLATLAGRRDSRLYALALAAIATLAIDPGIGRDVGWQLSFAAVLGILALAAPLRSALESGLGPFGPLGRALCEGVALTVSATIATAPLVSFHFGELSTVTLVANLLAMPAVAPAMWLGMLSAGAAQVPGLPLEPLNAVNAALLAYVAEVASWCARPSWASLELQIGPLALATSYAALAALSLAANLLRHPTADGPKCPAGADNSARRRAAGVLAGACVALLALLWPSGPGPLPPPAGLRVSFLDVGQGDAILLQPPAAPAVLVDGGPPGSGVGSLLRERGAGRLGAAIVTHDQSDHAGGLVESLDEVAVSRLLYARAGRQTLAQVRAAGVEPRQVAAGDELRSGSLRLAVLWPPRVLLEGGGAGEDPNRLALVILVRWHRFSLLLSADAEAEAVPLDPGPVDVLKVAHHGSDDAGLGALLERARPRIAVISVGEGNSYGHPTAATVAELARHGVRLLRTDRDGTVVLDVGLRRLAVSTG